MNGSLEVRPSEVELVAAYRLHAGHMKPLFILGFIAFGAIIGLCVAGIDGFRDTGRTLVTVGATALWAAFVLLVLAGVRFVWLPRYARRIFSQQKDLQSPITIEWNDSHFIATALGGRAEMPWTDFYQWKRNEAMFLLYRSEALFNFVPLGNREAIAAADDMQRLLVVAGVKEKK